MRLGLSRNFWLMLAAIAVVTAAAIELPRLYRVALLGSGYMAQTLCAGLFIAGRDLDSLMTEDLSGPGLDALGLFTPTLDPDAREVSASAFGIAGQTAINALVALRVKDGALALDDTRLMPEWRGDDDPRGAITLDELMRMTSGLAFDESYNNQLSDISQMLFVHGDGAAFAASKPLIHEPGTHWSYSGGTTEIIAAILRETFADERAYLRFPRERLFAPLGMRTAELAPDASGTLMGASSLYASARDWARLGLLFLQDGVWRGERLLPEGWVAYSLEPTPQSPHDDYGAQIWLKLPESPGLGEPPMPADGFYMLGYDGQVVATVPSRDLVIVRLGLTQRGGDWETARDLAPLVNAFPPRDAR